MKYLPPFVFAVLFVASAGAGVWAAPIAPLAAMCVDASLVSFMCFIVSLIEGITR